MNKDNEVNDEFDDGIDSDLDNDFGEFDSDPQRTSIGKVIKENPAVKIGLVVAALLVVIGAITLFGGSTETAPSSSVGGGNDVREIPGTAELSPEMRAVMEENNEQRVEQAQREGTSVIPQPIDTPKEQLPVPVDETPADDPLQRWREIQEKRVATQTTTQQQVVAQQQPAQDAARSQALQGLITSMNTQMSQILASKKSGGIQSMTITDIKALMAARQQAEQQLAQLNGGNNGFPQQANAMIDPTTGLPMNTTPAKILLPAGAIEYAQLLIEANSDVEGPIVSMIVSGPFAGSRVLGTFQRKEKYLVLQFSTLVNKKGISIPINAYALDPDTTLTGMATDVDNRYWQRVILPAAAEFVSGMGQAYADQQGDTTIVTGDVVVQDKPPLNTEEQIAAGVSEAADRVSEILDEEGDKIEPLVRVRAGTPMGILFMAPITDQDVIAGTTNPTSARIANQQQQQNLFQQQLFQQQQQAGNPAYLIQGLPGLQQGGLQGFQQMQQQGTGTAGASSGTSGIQSNNNWPSNIFSSQQYLNQSR